MKTVVSQEKDIYVVTAIIVGSFPTVVFRTSRTIHAFSVLDQFQGNPFA